MPPTVAGTYSTALPGMGTPPTTKAPYNNAGLSFNVGGDHSLGPQGGPYGRSTIITRMASY